MRFEAVIFDFDGTLVDSVAAKRAAFFDIFPAGAAYEEALAEVLEENPDASRFMIIPRILERLTALGLQLPTGQDAADRVAAFGQRALQRVESCAEIPGATAILNSLCRSGQRLFVSSNTPAEPLKELLRRRGWNDLFEAVYGNPPTLKTAAAVQILARLALPPTAVAVIGDGEPDEAMARAIGASFFLIREPADLRRHAISWGVADAGI